MSIYSSMLGSLCLDLGYVLDPDYRIEELGALKNELTKLAESRFTDDQYAPFVARLRKTVKDPNREFDRISTPCVFRDVYQVLSFLLKKPAETTETQENEYIEKFKAAERETSAWRFDPTREESRVARSIVRYLTSRGPCLDAETLIARGRHGPGAVLGGERGSDKNHFSNLPKTARGLLGCLTLYANDFLADLEHVSDDVYVESKLALVPKSYKGPRGVFISPKEVVFCQLAIDDCLKEAVKLTGFDSCWDPRSQTPSQELAYAGSYSGWYATLDLSDASDRIPLALVNALFRRSDYLALARSRPSHVRLPNGERHRLAMFAPMGDGKTFSVLSIVCLSLSLAAIYVARGNVAARFNVRELRRCMRGVRVFGDDIIVPSEYYSAVVRTLENHNLKVNLSKSFVNGKFREACGCDAFDGVYVTPLRVTSRMWELSDETLTNWVAFHNRIATNYPRFERLKALVEKYICDAYPDLGRTSRPDRNPGCLIGRYGSVVHYVRSPDSAHSPWRKTESPSADGISYHVPDTKGLKVRLNADLQRLEQRCIVVREKLIYPPSLDPRWDLSYWLLPKSRSVDTVTPYEAPRRQVVGSPQEYRLQLITWRRIRDYAIKHRLPVPRWLYPDHPERTLQYAWVPLE